MYLMSSGVSKLLTGIVCTFILFPPPAVRWPLSPQAAKQSVSQDCGAAEYNSELPKTSQTPAHLFLLTCKIPYHGALNSILYITGLDLMFPNANPTAPKLPFNPFSPHTPPFPLIFPPFSLFLQNRILIFFFFFFKAVGFVSRCNYIPRKFCSAITCLCRHFLSLP